jgi:hypothetical protein
MNAKHYFNTSGPNILAEHYTLLRPNLIEKGKDLVLKKRYFTIWAPRQTGKSTYFRLLAIELEKDGYRVAHINFENYKTTTELELLNSLRIDFKKYWKLEFLSKTFVEFFDEIRIIEDQKFIFICDEIEGLNPDLLNQFLHTIRNLYHSREHHSLKSVILVGVSNITGIMQDNASPFNIADEFNIPYFTNEETFELLAQHEIETGQIFDFKVKEKICEITANQPGLVNGFAKQLVDRNIDKPVIEFEDYLIVEDWYLNKAIDKNIANILKIAKQHRTFLERLLFKDEEIQFKMDNSVIEKLHVNGLITYDVKGNIQFWVPLYKKRVYEALYPYTNGESQHIKQSFPTYNILTESGEFHLDKLIESYKVYIKRRSFRPFREKDEDGKYKSIPEAVMVYSFETYIQSFLQMVGAKSYREAQVSLGNSDLIINVLGKEYLIETKIYYYDKQFQDGKKQLSYYCKSLGLSIGIYLVFVANNIMYPERAKEGVEMIDGVEIKVYLVQYDEEKDF